MTNFDTRPSRPVVDGICVRLGLPPWAVRVGCAIAFLTLWPLAGHAQSVTATVPVGTLPVAVAVNPVTNKIYVANQNTANVTVIDGATNATTTVPAGTTAAPGVLAVAVNPVTNKIYVANKGSNVTVIDGATNATQTVDAGLLPSAVAVNPVTNKIYVVNGGSPSVTVIDGATNATATVTVAAGGSVIAVNPVTNKIYVANSVTQAR